MHFKYLLPLFSIALLVFVACKKDTPEPDPVVDQQYIAPCSIVETVYDIDSVYFGPSSAQPEAKYRVKFLDTAVNGNVTHYVEFGFNKIPTSGKYNFVYKIDTNNLNNANQIAFVKDSGSFLWRSSFTEFNEIYVEKNNQELIISYCNLPDTNIYFNSADFCFYGNRPRSYKIRKQF